MWPNVHASLVPSQCERGLDAVPLVSGGNKMPLDLAPLEMSGRERGPGLAQLLPFQTPHATPPSHAVVKQTGRVCPAPQQWCERVICRHGAALSGPYCRQLGE
uniref:Uncharacterized protein n=1 Tax=Knipowitschia caucasica TaxID=637954 RepID=A0AAV2MQQ9_KNICA